MVILLYFYKCHSKNKSLCERIYDTNKNDTLLHSVNTIHWIHKRINMQINKQSNTQSLPYYGTRAPEEWITQGSKSKLYCGIFLIEDNL
jgi:hypothetical protein